tara:strand:+ start:8121 stop:8354 length:234 start_codon:yes stop_codon:yes gene_type:complete
MARARIEYNKRPRSKSQRRANLVWNGARMVFGSPPTSMTIIKAGQGKSTEWIIRKNEDKIQLSGDSKTVYQKLMEMV